ncbi:AzlC family ABC transporter permease [Primorskyibacter sp. S187A]|uniref:AzlC family ABC transporter permease n=1 Tax=Primorskyibacter sp. S187A TaxID=3415130 RepID=UPI003C7D4A7F
MSSTSPRREFWRGVRAAMPFAIVIIPFSMLFGLVATEAGLSLFETMTFSLVVIAGAAQFTALGLMQENAPTVIVIISALAVNMRMAMYSASLVPHMGPLPFWERALVAYFMVDQPYALTANRFEDEPGRPLREHKAFYWGCTWVVVPLWWSMTLLGALVGQSIPDWLALDFAVPITFLAVVAPMLRTRAHLIAAGAAILSALAFAWLPYNLGLIVGGMIGMMAGAEAERRGLA